MVARYDGAARANDRVLPDVDLLMRRVDKACITPDFYIVIDIYILGRVKVHRIFDKGILASTPERGKAGEMPPDEKSPLVPGKIYPTMSYGLQYHLDEPVSLD